MQKISCCVMNDDSCPTCGSKNFGKIEMKRDGNNVKWKIQCYNCKKFWFDVINSELL